MKLSSFKCIQHLINVCLDSFRLLESARKTCYQKMQNCLFLLHYTIAYRMVWFVFGHWICVIFHTRCYPYGQDNWATILNMHKISNFINNLFYRVQWNSIWWLIPKKFNALARIWSMVNDNSVFYLTGNKGLTISYI